MYCSNRQLQLTFSHSFGLMNFNIFLSTEYLTIYTTTTLVSYVLLCSLTMCLYILHEYAPSDDSSPCIDLPLHHPPIQVEHYQLILANVCMGLTL